MKVHTYVIATDAGSAPNYDPPFVTLAVCKPRIRRKANIGELVLAFSGKAVNEFEPHAVVWAGIVAEKMSFAEYWQDKRFDAKKPYGSRHPDNFYRPDGKQLVWVSNTTHGPEATTRDTGGLYVLIFNPSWRFGAHGPLLPEEFGLRMTVGRRGEPLIDMSEPQWRRLKSWLDKQLTISVSNARSENDSRPKRRSGCSA